MTLGTQQERDQGVAASGKHHIDTVPFNIRYEEQPSPVAPEKVGFPSIESQPCFTVRRTYSVAQSRTKSFKVVAAEI